ncbi:MAG: enoyl-CoA hydratase, partial [Actinobacteria bacterium]|nr:enoyl-CoA hydratase [Actinomycetota bacterium]
IESNSPFGVWMTKEVMWSNLEIPSLRAGIDMENRTQILASGTEDSKKAMTSFLSRTQVDWNNR